MLIRGDRLNPQQRKLVLTCFVHRHTYDNKAYNNDCPACRQQKQCGGEMVINGVPFHEYHSPLISDNEWLKRYAFYFNVDGKKLSANKNYAVPANFAKNANVLL